MIQTQILCTICSKKSTVYINPNYYCSPCGLKKTLEMAEGQKKDRKRFRINDEIMERNTGNKWCDL